MVRSSKSQVTTCVSGVSWSSSKAEPAAGGADGLGVVLADQPAGGVDLVDAVVDDVAAGVVPEPVPGVVEAVGVERPLAGPGRATCRSRRPAACGASCLWPMVARCFMFSTRTRWTLPSLPDRMYSTASRV